MDLQELTANTHPWTQPSRMFSISPASPLHPVVRTTARLREEAILNRYDLHNNNKQQENSQLPANEVTHVLSPPDQPCGWRSPGLTDRGCKTPVPGTPCVPASRSDLQPGRVFHPSGSSFRKDRVLLTVFGLLPVLPKTSVSSRFFLGSPLKREKCKGGAFHPSHTPFFFFFLVADSPSG